ncbi:uncharacterized protein DUF3836 [Bacteroides zoogleoformans]|uniref:DUF3836 domain-containing protein n=1 Tax=Bacteroides zoogleoformans TaxID=28119 RepID=A0ABM6T7L9_9BACE|nr:DUF3836 domain-containing protein [Bacteroides zoogleoformans]AVM52742.1 hypothetical protein C4H11_07170 [Bacteroides zoogleoformans]TWJ16668.1 uncharacterized protein DUF3836 [Bacteroides zoogleoformans]
METTVLFKAMAFAAMIMTTAMNMEVKAQEGNFITNEEVKNDLVMAKTIFKQEGSYLSKQFRYEFTYDEQNRLTGKQASKWDSVNEQWMPYYKMTYTYGTEEIIVDYARWNEKHRAYDKDVQRSRYELNDENMPVAQKIYRQDAATHEWTMVSFDKKDHTANGWA